MELKNNEKNKDITYRLVTFVIAMSLIKNIAEAMFAIELTDIAELVISLVALISWILISYFYAKSLNRSTWWTLTGLFPLLGFLFMKIFLKRID